MPSRRQLFGMLAAAAAGGANIDTGVSGEAPSTRRIPQRPTARVIVDNDFAGDPDSLVALAHG